MTIIESIQYYLPELMQAMEETLIMMSISIFAAVLIGLPLGILLFISRENNNQGTILYQILNLLITVIRSFPYCDEPTSALDEDTKGDVLSLLQKVHGTFQPTIVFVSHELSAVRQVCERVYVMEQGRIVAEVANTPHLLQKEELNYVDRVIRSLKHDDN